MMQEACSNPNRSSSAYLTAPYRNEGEGARDEVTSRSRLKQTRCWHDLKNSRTECQLPDPAEMMISDLIQKYASEQTSEEFMRLYSDQRFGCVFARIHEQLNGHFASINDRARSTRHYWAESSRDLIRLIDELNDALETFEQVGLPVQFSTDYRSEIDRCTPWLASSHGSEVPEGFQLIKLIKYAPIFMLSGTEITLATGTVRRNLRIVGEGSYALVYSFADPNYGIKFALKRAKKNLDARDLARFVEEFKVLKSLRFPYLVEVYKYEKERNEYTMEFCEDTLRSYISRRNAVLSSAVRRRIALQFLYGINYLHTKNYLHRDVSLQNVLLKVYDDGAVLVKLSDFGLVKDRASDFTRTETEMRGTIRDPLLESFKSYDLHNEIFSIGYVLAYIFTGKEAIRVEDARVGHIVRRCVSLDLLERYNNVSSIISDVEQIPTSPRDAPA